ncbi:ABC transporter ATP-binding protein [Kribbella sancticallisti]|uniref:ABC transporter ATP-binding protein n=1 Tax=Kribbella sancticallisti TaxID=460087 RepID=A0ABN2ELX9_9ACTN
MSILDAQDGPAGARTRAEAAVTLDCEDLAVRFGSFSALDGVSASWRGGAVNVVVGQNGAGKTTLARVVGGLQEPVAGRVRVDEAELPWGSVSGARQRGVELVHQHFSLPREFTVAQALELFSSAAGAAKLFSRRALRVRAAAALARTGVEVDPDAKIGSLPVESVQALEITRALVSQPRVLILDEPTAVLPPPGITALFERVRELADSGICLLLVLHKLSEVYEIADTVTVLRDGRLVLPPTDPGEVSRQDLAELIVGQATPDPPKVAPPPEGAPVVLRATALASRASGHDAAIDLPGLEIAAGEIVGIAGVEGNGQRSLVEALIGVAPLDDGQVWLDGVEITGASVRKRRSLGLRAIPFDRNVEGVSRSGSLWENHAVLRRSTDRWWLARRRQRQRCRNDLDRWNVRYRSEQQPAGDLSGGNVQKLILARELNEGVRFIVAAHPTRGLDLGAATAVRSAMATATGSGTAMLLVSADLDELFLLSHRIVVLCGGRPTGVFTAPFDRAAIGWAMTAGEPS